MWEKNLNQKLLLIGAVMAFGLFMLWPPKEQLRPGLDIAGGFELIFEIDDTGLEDDPTLAERMIGLLRKRVDPKGVSDIQWRVLGRKRISVQMPLPPKEATVLREQYVAANQRLIDSSFSRGDLENALRLTEPQRSEELRRLADGSVNRERLLLSAAQSHDIWVAAKEAKDKGPSTSAPAEPESQPAEAETQPTTTPASAPIRPQTARELQIAERDAKDDSHDALDEALATNLNPNRFQEVLELDPTSAIRKKSLEVFREDFPKLTNLINEVVTKHGEWRKNRGFLDGPADLRRLMSGAGKLEWRILADPSNPIVDTYRTRLREQGPKPEPGETDFKWFPVDSPIAFFSLDSPRELEQLDTRTLTLWVADQFDDTWYVLSKLGEKHEMRKTAARPWQLLRASQNLGSTGRREVYFNLDAAGGSLFRDLTRANVKKQLCMFLDDVAYSAARIDEAIGARGRITGDFSVEKAAYLVRSMQAGALPARLKDTPLSERTIGSSLGETNRDKALWAGIYGLIVVGLMMGAYYLVNGAIANLALVMNIVLVLAAMAMLGARFTLAGIAGVILTIGMTVDANVLIFERMREEQERGSSLRMIIKNGYEKALSTIIDANITTLLICAIIYYVGSEEIRGFGLTLGWGIVISLFTSLFVTRTVFTLLVKHQLIKQISMFKLIGVPNIDWYAKRKIFIPLSAIIIVCGISALYFRGREDLLDVEFLGGVEAEIEIQEQAVGSLDDVGMRDLIRTVGQSIADDAARLSALDDSAVRAGDDPNAFRVSLSGVPAKRLAAMLTEPLQEFEPRPLLVRGGVDDSIGEEEIQLRVPPDVTREQLLAAIRSLGAGVSRAGENIGKAKINSVVEFGAQADQGRFWNFTTTVTNKALVQHALVAALGDSLKIQPRVTYLIRDNEDGLPFPIERRALVDVVPGLPAGADADVTDFLGGAAIVFERLDPPQTIDELEVRLRNMRLQPDYQEMPYRQVRVVGTERAAAGSNGQTRYSSVVVLVVDPFDSSVAFDTNPEAWRDNLARPYTGFIRATLDNEQSLRKVTQFKPQIASQSQTRAGMALLLSWAVIIGYLWIRFGRPMFGIAGVCALVHDVLIALAFVGFSGVIGGANHPFGAFLLIDDFKIDMTIVAAFLTIIGYSINDTIVIFDRIRETRGRLGVVTPQVINRSINQCISRTLITSVTTFVVLLVMYIFGGSSIRGFNFCMMIGVLTGTYSSIAVAAPLLMLGREGRTARAPAPAPATR